MIHDDSNKTLFTLTIAVVAIDPLDHVGGVDTHPVGRIDDVEIQSQLLLRPPHVVVGGEVHVGKHDLSTLEVDAGREL